MNLDKAEKLAEKVRGELSPYCSRIMVAGSIRRRRAEVNDIDLVILPKDMGGLIKRVQRTCTVAGNPEGQQNLRFQFQNGFQLDLWIARHGFGDLFGNQPSNWGAVLLCRTGSMAHNISLCDLAKSKGLKFAPYQGVINPRNNEVLAAESEEQIYRALGLDYREPTERETL